MADRSSRELIDDLDVLLAALPPEIVAAIHALAERSDLIDFGLGVIAARTSRGGDHRHDHGIIAPVRTYEAPIDRRLEEAGFDQISTVTLLMKETLVRVAEPALVPAGVR